MTTTRSTFLLFVLAGCNFESTTVLQPKDGGSPSSDAAPLGDALPPADASPDAFVIPSDPLRSLLQCDLSYEEAQRAFARRVACDPFREVEYGRFSLVSLTEAYDAYLIGALHEVDNTAGWDVTIGCDTYQCLAEATSCEEANVCTTRETCVAGEDPAYCDGTRLRQCKPGSTARGAPGGWVTLVDCAALGATCEAGRCVREGCEFGQFEAHLLLECDEDQNLSLCDGTFVSQCSDLGAGGACRWLAIGGEATSPYCGTTNAGAGAYAYGGSGFNAVECEAGRFARFDSLGAPRVYDCVAMGYSGCDERGCVE